MSDTTKLHLVMIEEIKSNFEISYKGDFRKLLKVDKNMIHSLEGKRISAITRLMWSEYEFHPDRKFRFDYCIPSIKVGIEIHGGAYLRGSVRHGAHHTPVGRKRDMIKMREANALGWIVGEFDYDDIENFEVIKWLDSVYFGRTRLYNT